MKRILCLIAFLMLPAFHTGAEEAKVPLMLLDADVRDVLQLYQHWTGRKVWVTLDLLMTIYIRVDGQIPKDEAIRTLRTTLLEKYGIELRDSGEKEAFATWSEDPKYKAVRAALIKASSKNPPSAAPNHQRVRIVEPKEPEK